VDDQERTVDPAGVGVSPPLVSVIIPAYNASRTIGRALASVWRQNYHPIEIIVVDDASTDTTRDVVEALPPSAVRLVVHPANQGAGAARNTGLREAVGEYVAFLDADDEWRPGKLARQIAVIERNPRCRLVSCDTLIVLVSGQTIRAHTVCPPSVGPQAWKALLVRNFIPTPTVLARRSDLLALNGFDPRLAIGEDFDMWIRLALTGEVEVIPDVLVNVYFRPSSLMRTHLRGELDFVLPMIQHHVETLSQRLDGKERRRILGGHYFEIGYRLYQQGLHRLALPLFWRSLLLGFRVAKSLTFLPHVFTMGAVTSLRRRRGLFTASGRGEAGHDPSYAGGSSPLTS
jgi:glycosyltransferase involved in cell wall biosynthesis